jgi:hypothetical protein
MGKETQSSFSYLLAKGELSPELDAQQLLLSYGEVWKLYYG